MYSHTSKSEKGLPIRRGFIGETWLILLFTLVHVHGGEIKNKKVAPFHFLSVVELLYLYYEYSTKGGTVIF